MWGSDQRVATPRVRRRWICVAKREWVEAKTIGAWSMVVRYGDEDVKASRKTWSVVCKLKRERRARSWLGWEELEGAKSEGARKGCLRAVVSSKLEVAARVRIVSWPPCVRLPPPFSRSRTPSLRYPLNPPRFLLFALYRRRRPLFVELLITFSPVV